MAEGSRIRRARRLMFFSAFTPPILFDAHHVWWEVTDDRLSSGELLEIGGITFLLLFVMSGPFRATRKTPNSWWEIGITGTISIMLMFSAIDTDSRADAETFSAVAVLAAAALLYFVAPVLIRKTVLGDLSREVVESDLTITFSPRRHGRVTLVVEPDEIAIIDGSQPQDEIRLTARFTEITAVNTWTEVQDTEWELPGAEGRKMFMPAGELLMISTPDTELVAAVDDTAKVKRFVEARIELARRRTAVHDE